MGEIKIGIACAIEAPVNKVRTFRAKPVCGRNRLSIRMIF
jgi:hypothetical protein